MSHYTLTRYQGLRGYDYRAVIYNGSVYCETGNSAHDRHCLPPTITVDNPDVQPILATETWDYIPVCDRCGAEHDYVYSAPTDTDTDTDTDDAPSE